MAIKIDFMSDVSQVVRDVSTLGDRLDQAADDLDHVGDSGKAAARSLEDVTDAGKGLDRIDAGDTARDLDQVADSSDDAARQLDGVERALDDVGDAGGDVGKELRGVGDDVERMTKDVESEVDVMDDKVKRAFRNMADHARDNTGKVATTSKRDFDRAGEATETFKDEARSNLSETLSSFDGSLEGMVDGLQGTLGGVVADLGPAGMIGAGAIAAGIGVGMAYAEKVADGINEQGEIAAALAEELRDVGGALDDLDLEARMQDWGGAIQDNREVWEVWQETAETGLEHIADIADRAGTDFEESFRGVTGSLEESQAMLEEVEGRISDLQTNRSGILDAYNRDTNAQENALHELKGEIEDNIDAQNRAVEIEELRADAIGVTNEQLAEQVEKHEELTGVLTSSEEAELDYLDTLEKSTATIKENGETIDKNTEKGRNNRRALIDLRDSIFDFAAAELEAGESTSAVSGQLQEQRDQFIRTAEAAGYTEDQAEQLADAYGLIPDDIITDVSAKGVDATKRQLNSIDRNVYTTVHVRESGVNSAKNRIRWAFTNMRVNVRVHPQIPTASIW